MKIALSILLLLFATVVQTPIIGVYFPTIQFYDWRLNGLTKWILFFLFPIAIFYFGSNFKRKFIKIPIYTISVIFFVLFLGISLLTKFRQDRIIDLESEVCTETACYRLYLREPANIVLDSWYLSLEKDWDTSYGFKLVQYKLIFDSALETLKLRKYEDSTIEVFDSNTGDVIAKIKN